MKLFILTFLLLVTPILGHAEQAIVKIEGMVCTSCVEGVEAHLKKAPEVESASVDLRSNTATVSFIKGKSLSDEAIKRIIADAGYEVTEVKRVS